MLTTVDALNWVAADNRRDPSTLAAVLQLDLPDPLAVAGELVERPLAAEQVVAFAALHPGPWQGTPSNLLDDLELVGADTLVEDSDTLPEWRQVARAALDLASTHAETWPYTSSREWRRPQGPVVVTALRAAGRAPAYAHQMFDAARAAGLAPDSFGYGPGVTPNVLTTLAAAGITDVGTLQEFTDAGLTLPEAADLASRGIAARAVLAAIADDIARDRWVDLLPGMPKHWFCDPDEPRSDSMLARGFSWDDLRSLVEHEWGQLRAYIMASGIHYGSRRSTGPLDADLVMQAAQVTSFDGWKSWLDALATGKGGATMRDATLPPLVAHPQLPTAIALVSDLIAAGVRPSHLGAYRSAGCRTVADVLAAVAAGISARRAKSLVEAHGVRTSNWRPLRIASLDALLAVHRGHPPAAADAAATPSE